MFEKRVNRYLGFICVGVVISWVIAVSIGINLCSRLIDNAAGYVALIGIAASAASVSIFAVIWLLFIFGGEFIFRDRRKQEEQE